MKTEIFEKRTRLNAPAQRVWEWHGRPDALERLSPPGERVRVIHRTHDGLVEGSRVTLAVGRLGLTWIAEHRDVVPGVGFRDVMVKGPFARWEHTHRFEPDGPDRSVLVDRVEYALPMGPFGRLLGGRFVRRKLEKLFEWRHRVTEREV